MTPTKFRPFPGGQTSFLFCNEREALFHGPRGRGATYALLLDFLRDVGKGYGRAWRGLILRTTYKGLIDIEAKALDLFSQVCPEAEYKQQPHSWHWPTGEMLMLAYIKGPKDYLANWHGQEWPWIGPDELTSWATSEVYELLGGALRTPDERIFCRIRATTNPYGRGKSWVKAMFVDPAPDCTPIPIADTEDPLTGRPQYRVAIRGERTENLALMKGAPEYHQAMMALKDPRLKAAWGLGSWDSDYGTFFENAWTYADPESMELMTPCVVQTFITPDTWPIERALDWGTSKPFAGIWVAIANGEEARLPNGETWCPPAGSVVVVDEYYGLAEGAINKGVHASSTEVAREFLRREWEAGYPLRVSAGPADGIWPGAQADPGEEHLAAKMGRVPSPVEGDLRKGVQFVKPIKHSGSRVQGWQILREMMEATHPDGEGGPDHPGLYVMEHCRHTIRTVGELPRSEKKEDDADTEAEDHIPDVLRYIALRRKLVRPKRDPGQAPPKIRRRPRVRRSETAGIY